MLIRPASTTARRALPAAALLPLALAAPAAAAPYNPGPGAKVRVDGVNGAQAATVAGSGKRVKVRGKFPAADGATTAEVRIARNGKTTHRRTVEFRRNADGEAILTSAVKVSKIGTYRVGVRVDGKLVGKPVEFEVLPRRVTRSSGAFTIRIAQRALRRSKYVVGRTGSLDARTGRAILAARKRTGLARTSTWDPALAERLARGDARWTVANPGHGRHVEADLSLQLVALIGEGGNVERIYPTSSGAPATPTILGSYRVYRKDYGTNELGMVHSAYFIRGYAIHGYASVPTYNASHGCLRVPVPDALSIYRWIRYGTIVDVRR